jgi:biotin operon repressor
LGTSARLLEVLSLLQLKRDWSSGELADRLGVSTQTVRSEIGKLREIGYPAISKLEHLVKAMFAPPVVTGCTT